MEIQYAMGGSHYTKPIALDSQLKTEGGLVFNGQGFNIPCEWVNITQQFYLTRYLRQETGVKISWVGGSIYHRVALGQQLKDKRGFDIPWVGGSHNIMGRGNTICRVFDIPWEGVVYSIAILLDSQLKIREGLTIPWIVGQCGQNIMGRGFNILWLGRGGQYFITFFSLFTIYEKSGF